MQLLTFQNINEVSVGDQVAYDGKIGDVVYDEAYRGGLRVDGKSLIHLIEYYDKVYLLT